MVTTELEFKEITLDDKEWIDRCLRESDFRGSEYSFANNYLWRKAYHLRVAEYKGMYIQRTGEENRRFAFPAGNGDGKAAVEWMMELAKKDGEPFRMLVSTQECVDQLEEWFPGKFAFRERRGYFDYLYLAENMMTFRGKKLHSKRNFVNRFTANNDWSVEPVTEENVEECRQFNEEWCKKNDGCQDDSKREEICAANTALKKLDVLGLKGCILRIEGNIVAYALGEPINSDTFIVHFEKADAEVPGAYPMIAQQMVKMHASEFTYINREEDLGVEGLRKAKMSFYPEGFVERYEVTLK